MRFQIEISEIVRMTRVRIAMKSILTGRGATWVGWCALLCVFSGTGIRPAVATGNDTPKTQANPFQVEIEVVEVLDSGEEKVQDRHIVLFNAGKAYDFALLGPHDVTVVDPTGNTVTLLSRESHVKSTLSSQALTAAAARVRAYATDLGKEDRLGIKAQPQRDTDSETENDPTETRYSVKFSGIQYKAVGTKPESDSQPVRIAEFTDWAAKVNLIRKLGTPPFARMKLGHLIAADGRVPSSITLQLNSNGKPRTFTSRYTFRMGLNKEDQSRLDKVAGMLTLYSEVPIEAFPR